MFGNKDATDAAFAAAPHVVSLRLESNRLSANAIEPRGAIGDYNAADDTYTLYSSNQDPHSMRKSLAELIFKQSESKFRVVAPDVGGGFGMKADAYPEEGPVLWASRRCRRPVKWIASRSESLQGDTHGRDQVVHGEMALDAAGKILAIRARSMHGFGAYVVSAAVAPLVFALRFIPSVYDVKAFHAVTQGVFTNTSPTGPYRGAGRPEATYLVERLLDRAAAELGIDRVEIRRRNLISQSQFPYATQTGLTVAAIERSGARAAVRLSDGTREEYDLVVGADGLFSGMRKLLFPEAAAPAFTGQACWRLVLPRPAAIDTRHFFLGGPVKVGLTPVSQDEMYMFLLEHVPDNPWRPLATQCALLRGLLVGFGGTLASIREGLSEQSQFIYRPLEGHLLRHHWWAGNTILIGDAAHATTPQLASGAGMALEDGIVLAGEVSRAASLPEAFGDFMRRRYKRCRMVVENSLEIGRLEVGGAPAAEQAMVVERSLNLLARPI